MIERRDEGQCGRATPGKSRDLLLLDRHVEGIPAQYVVKRPVSRIGYQVCVCDCRMHMEVRHPLQKGEVDGRQDRGHKVYVSGLLRIDDCGGLGYRNQPQLLEPDTLQIVIEWIADQYDFAIPPLAQAEGSTADDVLGSGPGRRRVFNRLPRHGKELVRGDQLKEKWCRLTQVYLKSEVVERANPQGIRTGLT